MTKMRYTYDPWYFFGNDFTFSNADLSFTYLEKLIPTFENLKMSLFSEYLDSMKLYPDVKLETYEEDFYVLEEANGDSWSGYFTSKPELKRKIRELGQSLRCFNDIVLLHFSDLQNSDNYIDI